mgnify:CR=1 FL=1
MFLPDEFDELVSEAIEEVPEEFRERLDNVEIVVEEEPSPQILKEMGLGRGMLLGLYQGVPRTKRNTWAMPVLPDRITIYRRPILAICRTRAQVVRQVRKTVVHEIAHHFGIGDAHLRRLGY